MTSVDIASPTRCYLHWPGTFLAGHGDHLFFYIIQRPEGGIYKGKGVGYKGNGWKLRKLTVFSNIFSRRRDLFSKWTVIFLSACSVALTGLTFGVLRIWVISVWLPVPLYRVVAVLYCFVIGISVAVVFEPWGTFDYLIFGACILWSYGTLFLDSLESLWLDNTRYGMVWYTRV